MHCVTKARQIVGVSGARACTRGATRAITVTNIGTGPRVFRFGDLDAFYSQERRFSPTINMLSPLTYPTLSPGEAASEEFYYETSGAERTIYCSRLR